MHSLSGLAQPAQLHRSLTALGLWVTIGMAPGPIGQMERCDPFLLMCSEGADLRIKKKFCDFILKSALSLPPLHLGLGPSQPSKGTSFQKSKCDKEAPSLFLV